FRRIRLGTRASHAPGLGRSFAPGTQKFRAENARMDLERTQVQSPADRVKSQDLSLRRTQPPAKVPGYDPERLLGEGAYGEVWVATERNTGRKVAVKFYTHRGGLDWSLLKREVEKLAFMSADRYVIQLIEVGWDSVLPYYVMEYLVHGSLEERLNEHGALPLD